MSFTEKQGQGFLQKQKNLKEIGEIITKAIKKLGAKKENDLCKYLPMNSGGYMHHFTLRKMKHKNPGELSSLIERYIINAEKPLIVPPKRRAPRGSRIRKDQVIFTRVQLEKMLHLARIANEKEIISLLSPKKSLATYKRELIRSIRQGKVDQNLWTGYTEVASANQLLASLPVKS